MSEFFTWNTLGSMAGATAAVTLVTQFFKWLSNNKATGWAVRAISFIVALGVLYLAAAIDGSLDAPTAVITALNAIIVTLAANGLYDDISSMKKA